MTRSSLFSLFVLAGVLLAGCRGMESDAPPIHPNLNMDYQERFDAQEANPFFADNRAMRPPVPGTVARGMLRDDTEFFLGRTASGEFVAEMPVPITRAFVNRGQERYNIYCSVCHGAAGDGLGIIMVGNSGQGFGYTPAPTFHTADLRAAAAGYLYNVVANGVRSMPGYAQQIPVADRWAIVSYIRALQRSQNAGPGDVPAGVLADLRAAAPAQAGVAPDTADAEVPQEPTTPPVPGVEAAPGSEQATDPLENDADQD